MHTFATFFAFVIAWLWSFAKDHPGITTPIVGALTTLVLKPRSPAQYARIAAKYPVWFWVRVAAFLQLLGAVFPDPGKITRVVLKVIYGTQDSDPQ